MRVAENVFVSVMSAPAAKYASMDVAHDVRARQHQQVVVTLEIAAMVVQAAGGGPAEIGFAEAPLLDHRSPRAIEDEDALFEEARELGGAVGLHGDGGVANVVPERQILSGACRRRSRRSRLARELRRTGAHNA